MMFTAALIIPTALLGVFTTGSYWAARQQFDTWPLLGVGYLTCLYYILLVFTTGSYWAARQQFDTWPLLGVGYLTWFVAWYVLSRLP